MLPFRFTRQRADTFLSRLAIYDAEVPERGPQMPSSVDFEKCPQLSQQFLHCQLWSETTANMQKLDENTAVATDTEGRVVRAQYANGCKLVRHWHYVIVSSAENGNWFGSETGDWSVWD